MRGNEKFYIHTFGCQMNENDSERMAGILKASGLEQTSSPEKSHIIIVNTCAVREKSEEKLFSLLGRLERIKRKNQALIGVTGCVAQLYRSKLWDRKPFIDFILGPDNYSQLPQILHLESEDRVVATRRKEVWQEIPYAQTLPDSRVSAYITIMEGCNNFCAYCVVPFTRGREKYRPLRLIVEEAEQLASRGVQEVQLLGQNVNSYVDPESAKTFSDLLKAVENVDGISWIRFITSHPKNFSDEIARTMERLCPRAMLLNFTNPEHKLCEALTRLTSIQTVGLCHG
ncbi:MAG: MiaB/RimO family radical SAM methylthiotransferase, partial [Candidatus Aminicenantales bacterium]